MNMFKKNGGFTLVELIVVIAILAILAAVAVPAYSGYIAKANEAADTTALAAVKTAAMGACATEGMVSKLEVKEGEVKIFLDGADTAKYTLAFANNAWTIANATTQVDDDFTAFMNKANLDLSYYASATWTVADGWTGTKAAN